MINTMAQPLFLDTIGPATNLASILLPVGLGLAAVYLLLPRVRRYPPLWGGALGGLALLLAGGFIVRVGVFRPEVFLFYAFSAIAIVSGVLLVIQANPVHAAISFALVVLSSCGLFLLLAAPFLMAATTIIYAGAIIVTFLFVIMLAHQSGISDADQRSREPFLAAAAGFVLLGAVLYILQMAYDTSNLDHLLRQTDDLLTQLDDREGRERVAAVPPAVRDKLKGLAQDYKGEAKRWRGLPDGKLLSDAAENLQLIAVDATESKASESLKELHTIGTQLSRNPSFLQAHATSPLSGFSGPPPNLLEADDIPQIDPNKMKRRDKLGRPPMPAENVAYLGRSLFTDYLLAVELGGTLLLVATIGAIAITHRRTEKGA